MAQAIYGAARDATARVAPKGADLSEVGTRIMGWINVNPTGAYNVPHDHPGSFWSGAYYVKNPASDDGNPSAGAISFIDCRSAPSGQPLVQAPVHQGMHTLRPAAGSMVLFPSSLRHWVQPNDSPEDRVTIAFNVFVFPAGGAAQPRS